MDGAGSGYEAEPRPWTQTRAALIKIDAPRFLPENYECFERDGTAWRRECFGSRKSARVVPAMEKEAMIVSTATGAGKIDAQAAAAEAHGRKIIGAAA